MVKGIWNKSGQDGHHLAMCRYKFFNVTGYIYIYTHSLSFSLYWLYMHFDVIVILGFDISRNIFHPYALAAYL